MYLVYCHEFQTFCSILFTPAHLNDGDHHYLIFYCDKIHGKYLDMEWVIAKIKICCTLILLFRHYGSTSLQSVATLFVYSVSERRFTRIQFRSVVSYLFVSLLSFFFCCKTFGNLLQNRPLEIIFQQ